MKTETGFTVPDGYEATIWNDVEPGQRVYLVGKRDGKPHAYGPHTVADIDKFILRNSQGREFVHAPEDLIVSTDPVQALHDGLQVKLKRRDDLYNELDMSLSVRALWSEAFDKGSVTTRVEMSGVQKRWRYVITRTDDKESRAFPFDDVPVALLMQHTPVKDAPERSDIARYIKQRTRREMRVELPKRRLG